MNNVRSRWPHVENDDEEPESTGVENEEGNELVNYCIQKNKDQVVSISSFHLLFVKYFTLI